MKKHRKADSSTSGWKQATPDSPSSVSLLFHASRCSDGYCTLPDCPKLRTDLNHSSLCHEWSKGTCATCADLLPLCLKHAKHCKAVELILELGAHAVKRQDPTDEGFTHNWTLYVRGAEGRNIRRITDRVVFHLRESFRQAEREIRKPPYSVSESGCARLSVPIDVYFRTREVPRKVTYILGKETKNLKVYFENPSPNFRAMLMKAGGKDKCPVTHCDDCKFKSPEIEQFLESIQARDPIINCDLDSDLTRVSSSTPDVGEQMLSNLQQNQSCSPYSDEIEIVPFVKSPPLVINLEENEESEKEAEKQVEKDGNDGASALNTLLGDDEEPKSKKPKSRLTNHSENAQKENMPVENVENTTLMNVVNTLSKKTDPIALSVKKLKQALDSRGISYFGVVEKRELIELVESSAAEQQVEKEDNDVASALNTLLGDNEEPKSKKPKSRLMNHSENAEKENIYTNAEKQVEMYINDGSSGFNTLLEDDEEPKSKRPKSRLMNQSENAEKVENVKNKPSVNVTNIPSKNTGPRKRKKVKKTNDTVKKHSNGSASIPIISLISPLQKQNKITVINNKGVRDDSAKKTNGSVEGHSRGFGDKSGISPISTLQKQIIPVINDKGVLVDLAKKTDDTVEGHSKECGDRPVISSISPLQKQMIPPINDVGVLDNSMDLMSPLHSEDTNELILLKQSYTSQVVQTSEKSTRSEKIPKRKSFGDALLEAESSKKKSEVPKKKPKVSKKEPELSKRERDVSKRERDVSKRERDLSEWEKKLSKEKDEIAKEKDEIDMKRKVEAEMKNQAEVSIQIQNTILEKEIFLKNQAELGIQIQNTILEKEIILKNQAELSIQIQNTILEKEIFLKNQAQLSIQSQKCHTRKRKSFARRGEL